MQIDGEFVTNLARTLFWDDHRPIQNSIDIIASCVQNATSDEIRTIVTDILEGRKKFVGVNEFQLVDDNERIRPLLDHIKTQEREKGIAAIRLDMKGNFRKYVDIWSTIKSSHIDVLMNHNMPQTFEECRKWYTMEKSLYSPYDDDSPYHGYNDIYIKNTPLYNTPTMGGLWLIEEPDLVYDACKGDLYLIGTLEFWKAIYEKKKYDPAFQSRNQRYLFSIKHKPSVEERIQYLIDAQQKKQKQKEPEYLSHEWFVYQYERTKDITYHLQPDDMEKWEGLIAPNGDFYSCEFGGHNSKAYYLLTQHPEWAPISEKSQQKDIRIDNALDVLIANGWCATRSVMYDHYVLPSFPKKPTKAQLDCILHAIDKHEVHINTYELYSYFD